MLPSRLGPILAVFASLLWPQPSPAQRASAPEITIEGTRGYPLLISSFGGSSGGEARALLEKCLARDGQFSFASAAAADTCTIRAQAASSNLEGSLTAPSGETLLRQTYRGDALRQLVFRFSDDIVRAVTGLPGIAMSRIAFVSDRSGHKEIYLCDSAGGQTRQLTRDQSLCVSPCLSRDGRLLAFTSYVEGYADVHLLETATGKRRRAFAEPGTNTGAAFSPSGNEIALTMSSPGNPELFVAPVSGGTARRLTTNRFVDSSPAWSPDGKHLVFVSDGNGRPQLFVVASSGGRPMALDTGFPECYEPSWSPDGKRIAFTTRSNGTHQIAVFDLQKKTRQVLTRGSGSEQPVWGPSSRHLIYLEGNAIVVHEIDSGFREPILSRFGAISELSWSQ